MIVRSKEWSLRFKTTYLAFSYICAFFPLFCIDIVNSIMVIKLLAIFLQVINYNKYSGYEFIIKERVDCTCRKHRRVCVWLQRWQWRLGVVGFWKCYYTCRSSVTKFRLRNHDRVCIWQQWRHEDFGYWKTSNTVIIIYKTLHAKNQQINLVSLLLNGDPFLIHLHTCWEVSGPCIGVDRLRHYWCSSISSDTWKKAVEINTLFTQLGKLKMKLWLKSRIKVR